MDRNRTAQFLSDVAAHVPRLRGAARPRSRQNEQALVDTWTKQLIDKGVDETIASRTVNALSASLRTTRDYIESIVELLEGAARADARTEQDRLKTLPGSDTRSPEHRRADRRAAITFGLG